MIKNTIPIFFLALLFAQFLQGQAGEWNKGFPLTISIFSESIGLPRPGRLFKHGVGFRVGTEFYYGNASGNPVFQTINMGYYRYGNQRSGLLISTELGYRHFFGSFFADATIGGGYLWSSGNQPVYSRNGDAYVPAPNHRHRFMPVAGLGVGYRFTHFSLFSRMEAFGEIPFLPGEPILPHRSVHFGARTQL